MDREKQETIILTLKITVITVLFIAGTVSLYLYASERYPSLDLMSLADFFDDKDAQPLSDSEKNFKQYEDDDVDFDDIVTFRSQNKKTEPDFSEAYSISKNVQFSSNTLNRSAIAVKNKENKTLEDKAKFSSEKSRMARFANKNTSASYRNSARNSYDGYYGKTRRRPVNSKYSANNKSGRMSKPLPKRRSR